MQLHEGRALASRRVLARKDYVTRMNSGQPGRKFVALPVPRNSGRLEFVEPVERGDFVCFGQSRVVEHGIAEIFDGAAVIQHGLSDVNNFSGGLADYVDHEQLAGSAVEEQFQ